MDKLSGQTRGQVWKRSLLYILLSTQNRSLALFRHATSPPPPQVKGRSIATGSRKDKFERMNYFSKVSSDTCMTIKKPKGLFLSILNKFSTPYLIDAKYTASLKKLTACHFLEGAKPVARKHGTRCLVQISGRKLSTRVFKIINEAPVINTCGLLHIALSVFYWKLQLLFIFLNLLPKFPYKSFIFTTILKITQYETIRIDD